MATDILAKEQILISGFRNLNKRFLVPHVEKNNRIVTLDLFILKHYVYAENKIN